jgi:hypothetical protein
MLGLVFGVGCLNGVLGLRAIWLDGVLRNLASFIFEMGRIKANTSQSGFLFNTSAFRFLR